MKPHKIRKAFTNQRSSAKTRGVAFKLSYVQWLAIWARSGKLEKRGRKRHQYCMARIGDKGPYAVGNVKITTFKQNCLERRFDKQTREKMGRAHIGKKHSEETKQKMSKNNSGRNNPMYGKRWSLAKRLAFGKARGGKNCSAETRRKRSVASLRMWAARREARA